jgi:hypothetical protein
MKRLLMLSTLALLAAGLTGCGQNRGSWWNRGAWCAPNGQSFAQPQVNYAPVDVYEDGVITQPGPPATIAPLPGPVR